MATYQVRIDADGEKVLSDPLSGLEGGIATEEAPGVVRPDGVTTRVDNTGVLSAIGGNLRLNSEEWITESGEWVAPVSGWYDVLLFGGGNGGGINIPSFVVNGGASGEMKSIVVYLQKGQTVEVVIGAGGLGVLVSATGSSNPIYSYLGGHTSFGSISTVDAVRFRDVPSTGFSSTSQYRALQAPGAGLGGGLFYFPESNKTQDENNIACSGYGLLGGGGAAVLGMDGQWAVGNGAPGSVRVRWYDPAKAAGPTE